MYRLALVLALLVMLAGCGGSSENNSRSAASSDAAKGATKVAETGDRSRSRKPDAAARDRTKIEPKKSQTEKPKAAGERPQSIDEALADAPAKDVLNLIRQAARATLELYDLELASVSASNGGSRVKVFITRASACRAVARDEPIMANQIRRAAPIVKSVSFVVAGAGEALGYYVLRCERPEVPSGPGKVVLERDGVGGPITTKTFRIRGKRWAIEYENGSSHLVALVLTEKNEANDPISSKNREVGRKVYNTGPGTYKLQIQGGGFWSVRVKDIR